MLTATLFLTLWDPSRLVDGQSMEFEYNSQPSEVPIIFEEEMQASPELPQEPSTSYEATAGFEASPTVNSAVVPDAEQQSNGDFTETPPSLIEIASMQGTPGGANASPAPGDARGLDAIVPFLLPLRPYAPIFSGPEGSIGVSGGAEDVGAFSIAGSSVETLAAPPRFAFYGPQSEDLRVDDCQHFDAFLVSPLPSSVASRFSNFVQKENAQTDGMPYLHHIHGRPAEDPADGEENPRLAVEGGKVTPLWSEFTEENPVFRMDEGTVTLIRLVAPVKSAYDAMASMMLMPIIDVNLAYGDGLVLSYKVSGEEGKQADHQHQDETHRPVAELHVVYKSCFAVEGDSRDPISPSKSGAASWTRSAADLPWDPSLAPSPTVAELRTVTAKEGDLVANGVATDRVAAVQPTTLVFDPSQEFVEMYAWCRGSADLQVMYPLLYNYVGSSKREETETEQSVSLVASKPSSHVVLRDVLPGLEENVRRFILQFQCKSEGESIVGMDFSFHGYRDVQIFLKKKCVAPASASLRDPSCSSGVLSEDGAVCCAASCGSCGGDGCEDREAQQNTATKELRMALALPEEAPAPAQRFSLLLAPLWLICFCLSILKLFLWCLVAGALVVYVFTVCYGIQVMKEPFPVAAAPSASQLFNTILLVAGHLRHLYKTHGGSVFAGEGFHSYTPFEERDGKAAGRKLSSKEDPFCPPVRWRVSEERTSCIRLTSFKAKAGREAHPNPHPPEVIRPLEFCDIEADGADIRDRNDPTDDTLWEEPQGDFQTDTWAEDTTAILGPQQDEYSNPQGSQHYRQFSGNSYEPF
ncbi:uncharacterized protein EMH_0007950 [Eimeria mitis]|uniref:Transmembrane protein n=1 Tax=Eimeria mitis TaxID=44415 RepID=U6KKZ4_9EIME|nr:uncharacterized protein EMH_0007950 [Eimeria mitis]CDJ36128.1 hypothetical protein, conserved [Eimeria mitis]